MPRKRKSDKPPTETITEQPPADVGAAVAEPPAAPPPVEQPKPESRSFAERVGQKQWKPVPDPFVIASDPEAGIKLYESEQDEQMAFKFGDGSTKDKPPQRVLDRMHQAGYQWNKFDRIWTFPVMPHSAKTTRIAAERLYQELWQILRQEKGIASASPEIAF